MATQFPGMDEIIKFLQEQEAKNFRKQPVPGLGRPAPAKPLYSGAEIPGTGVPDLSKERVPGLGRPEQAPAAPKPVGEGIFNVREGSGGELVRKALGRVASPVPAGAVSLLAPTAWSAGQKLSDMAMGDVRDPEGNPVKRSSDRGRRIMSEQAYDGRKLPDFAPPVKTESLKKTQQVSAPKPDALRFSSEQANLPLEADLVSQSDEIPPEERVKEAGPELETPAEAATDTVPDESSLGQPAMTEEQQVMEAIKELLTGKPPAPVREETPGSAAVIDEVTKPNVAPKETFGRSLKRFIVAGSGPVNFSRLDQQEAEARNAQQSLTEKEKVKAGLATSDIEGARTFNRQSQLKREDTGGVTDRDKMQYGALMDQYKMATGDSRAVKMAGIEHANRMAEIGAGAQNQRLTPEQQKAAGQRDVMSKNLEGFDADTIEQVFGVRPSDEGLKVLREAKLKDNPMTLMLSQILAERLQGMKGQTGGANKAPISVRALTEKTQPAKK